MKSERSGLAPSGKPAEKPMAYSRPQTAMKALEPRKLPFRHLCRMQSAVTNEMREIGLTLHEILALTDIMREAYGNGDMADLHHGLPLLKSKAASLESAVSNIIGQMN